MAIKMNPAVSPICDLCGYHLWVEEKMGKRVATHPKTPTCSDSRKAFEIPTFYCPPLGDEFASDEV